MQTQLISHKDITPQILNEICRLKSLHWHFSPDQQLDWMQKNIRDEDYHLLITDRNELMAYMNLVDLKVCINNELQPFMGIGNVCTRTSGKGLGSVLMDKANNSLLEHNWQGILLCKDKLVPYYAKFGWDIVDKSYIIQQQYKEINVMTFNSKSPVNTLSYDGRNF